jgi:hypothetical protein
MKTLWHKAYLSIIPLVASLALATISIEPVYGMPIPAISVAKKCGILFKKFLSFGFGNKKKTLTEQPPLIGKNVDLEVFTPDNPAETALLLSGVVENPNGLPELRIVLNKQDGIQGATSGDSSQVLPEGIELVESNQTTVVKIPVKQQKPFWIRIQAGSIVAPEKMKLGIKDINKIHNNFFLTGELPLELRSDVSLIRLLEAAKRHRKKEFSGYDLRELIRSDFELQLQGQGFQRNIDYELNGIREFVSPYDMNELNVIFCVLMRLDPSFVLNLRENLHFLMEFPEMEKAMTYFYIKQFENAFYNTVHLFVGELPATFPFERYSQQFKVSFKEIATSKEYRPTFLSQLISVKQTELEQAKTKLMAEQKSAINAIGNAESRQIAANSVKEAEKVVRQLEVKLDALRKERNEL